MLSAFLLLSQLSATSPDCGASTHIHKIERTHALIEKSVEPVFNDETVNMDSNSVCVRMEFSIDGSGRAVNIKIAEGYISRGFNRAVKKALAEFQFCQPSKNEKNDFMLVFRPWTPIK